jgi:hypothetical protein
MLTLLRNLSTFLPVAKKVQVGQVWKKDDTGETYLITKVYNEALATYAVLRKTGAESEPPVRMKVVHTAQASLIPGYTSTQQADDF